MWYLSEQTHSWAHGGYFNIPDAITGADQEEIASDRAKAIPI